MPWRNAPQRFLHGIASTAWSKHGTSPEMRYKTQTDMFMITSNKTGTGSTGSDVELELKVQLWNRN